MAIPISEKTFKAKVNLPGGCNKGTIVFNGKYVETRKVCPYDCENEKDFFEEILPPKYSVNSNIILKTQQSYQGCNIVGETTRRNFLLPAFTEFTIVGEKKKNTILYVIVKNGEYYYLIPEKEIFPADIYFYLSSKGIIHCCYVGREPKADSYRKLVDNYHKTKPEAQIYKDKLMLPRKSK
jgi:hypothetical protein